MFLLAFLLCQVPPHASAGARTSATLHPAFRPLDPAAGGPTGLLHSWRNDDLTATQTASLTGTWHLAVASYDGHSRRLSLDGVPFAADAPANQPDTNVLIHGLVPWRTSTHTPPRTSTSATLTAHRC